jgi:hypothetical protein
MYYDRRGYPMSWREYVFLLTTYGEGYKRVAQTTFGRYWISTVWLGLDHGYGRGAPVIFETMVFDLGADGHNFLDHYCERYCTLEEAFAGHDTIAFMVMTLEAVGQLQELPALTAC